MMSAKNLYIGGVTLAAALGWASWLLVLVKMSPFFSGNLALTLFYASLSVALIGTFTLLIYYLRVWIGEKPPAAYLNTALREGVLLALLVTVSLIFQRLRVLTWWDGLLLLAIVFLIEFYALARD